MKYRYISLEYLDTMTGGDRDLRLSLLKLIQEELKKAIPDMRTHLLRSDWERMHATAHKLKSTLAFVGNRHMTKANEHILHALEGKKYQADFSSWLKILEQQAAKVLPEIKKEMEPPASFRR